MHDHHWQTFAGRLMDIERAVAEQAAAVGQHARAAMLGQFRTEIAAGLDRRAAPGAVLELVGCAAAGGAALLELLDRLVGIGDPVGRRALADLQANAEGLAAPSDPYLRAR
jgi:hypothetical protein